MTIDAFCGIMVGEAWSMTVMPGVGRPANRPAILNVRELTSRDLQQFKQGRDPPIKRYRDSHHQMARLFGMGLRVSEVARIMGYSVARISVHYNNPAFKELVAKYSGVNDEVYKDRIAAYDDLILSNGMKAERKIADKLDDDENNEMSVRELLGIARDAADRVGLSKRLLQTNVNIDFASMLDKAIARSARPALPRSADVKLIESPPAVADRGPFDLCGNVDPKPKPFTRRF